ncbi:MAG: TIGR04282 family arsenosugar biosynthesis glycosyltransferase [Nitrospirae bacterium]|nr:TIGR04282 family arsenosugar biosynthesis glycosyltransferase [Nitrospirota bacterium]
MPAIKKALIIFAKVPKPGQVKTRLQPDLPPDASARLYLAFILDILNATASLKGVTRMLGCDSSRRDPFFMGLAERHGLDLIDQTGKDLGVRMQSAIAEAYRLGFDQAVIIGTDIPTLPVGYIQEAFKLLKRYSLVLGPGTDGGYYLVGCSGSVPPIFDGVAWGTERVLTQTLQRIAESNLNAALLPFWYDVDTIQDVRWLSEHLSYLERRAGKPVASETARVLKTLKLGGP